MVQDRPVHDELRTDPDLNFSKLKFPSLSSRHASSLRVDVSEGRSSPIHKGFVPGTESGFIRLQTDSQNRPALSH